MISRRELYVLGEPLGNGATLVKYGYKRIYGGGGDSGDSGDSDSPSGLEGAPDVGTIGGTMSDSFGENSATLGGGMHGDQSAANSQAMGLGADAWGGYDWGAAGFSDPYSFDSMDLANMFGAQYSQGLPTAVSDQAYSSDATFGSFMESPFGKSLRGILGIVNPTAAALTNAAYAGYTGNTPGMLGSLASAVTGNSIVGRGVALGTAAAQGKNVAGPLGATIGGTVGSYTGGQIGGPFGAMAGGLAGSALGHAAATGKGSTQGGNMSGFTDGGGNTNWGNLVGAGLGTLGNIYLRNQAAQQAQGNVQDLGAMFGPNSAYAQQLRQQLERRDAKAGRRSQYGPREVELQAKLAEMAANYGPRISQQNMAAQQVAQQNRAQNLSALYALGRSSGAFDWAGRQLGDIFTPTPDYTFAPSSPSPYIEMSPETYQELSDYGVF